VLLGEKLEPRTFWQGVRPWNVKSGAVPIYHSEAHRVVAEDGNLMALLARLHGCTVQELRWWPDRLRLQPPHDLGFADAAHCCGGAAPSQAQHAAVAFASAGGRFEFAPGSHVTGRREALAQAYANTLRPEESCFAVGLETAPAPVRGPPVGEAVEAAPVGFGRIVAL
jgi:hypothetical protein